MNILPLDLVSLAGDQPITDSLRVAQHFGKQHREVLRAIDRLGCSKEFWRCNFAQRTYRDSRGKTWRNFELTKNGFMFLAMGFTGAKADQMKEAFILAFDSMADQLANRDIGIMKRLLEHELRDMDSRRRGQFHGKGLARRRVEKKVLRSEEAELQQIAQPTLFQLVRDPKGRR